ncbi:MAG: hypothetical protein JO171_07295 [Paludibacterium sp.]|uniref:hypothetical protein n=1 Tax=Paludibacterium sp. TaxID=1917523 RepID=UPI0025FF04BD|nr:hypothetical protein [Paludibacterium sp.]MBV8046939.1 hypothetical protein [Paludibacterium sp.]MBV8646532.1 hypothetical protein [Paludibacterium sp.]
MKNPRTLLAALSTVLLFGCDASGSTTEQDQQQDVTDATYFKALATRQSLTCPLPKGMRAFKPISHIKPDDLKTQTLAREYVELKRRETQVSWQSAAQYFNQDQYAAENWLARMQSLTATLDDGLQTYRKNNYNFATPLDEYALSLADQYRNACKQYIQANSEWVGKDQALQKLRQEKPQPWLAPDRPLTCSMLAGKNCYDD